MTHVNKGIMSVSVLWLVMFLATAYAEGPTDEELKSLEQQIEQQEANQAEALKRRDAEVKRKAEEEAQKQAEEAQRLKEEEVSRQQQAVEIEKRQKEEALKAENEKKEIYDNYINKASVYMDEEKYNQAIEEYEQLLRSFPDDIKAQEGIRNAQKLLSSCNDIIGSWKLSHGPTWVINNDNSADGKWLVFSAKGVWKCLSAKKREFVVSWPGHGWIDYFNLSEDAKTLIPTRNSKITGFRITDEKDDSETNKQLQFGR